MYFHGVEEVVVVEGAVVVTVMPVALARRRSQRGRAFATFAGSVPVCTSRCRRDRYEWRDLPPTVAPPEHTINIHTIATFKNVIMLVLLIKQPRGSYFPGQHA